MSEELNEQSATDETKDSAQQESTGAKDAQGTSDDFDKALSEFESAEGRLPNRRQQSNPTPAKKTSLRA